MKVEFSKKEVRELKIVLYAEAKSYRDRMNHAALHGAEYIETDSEILLDVLRKIDPAAVFTGE